MEDASAPSMPSVDDGDVMNGGAREVEGGTRMPEPPPTPPTDEDAAEYPDMEPAHTPPPEAGGAAAYAAGEQGEGYLRLVIEVDDGELRLVDAAVVDGPLVQPDLTGLMAYEALVRGRRVAADAFDDLSRQRGLAPPDDPSAGHSVADVSRYQFVARIPRSEVTAEELADLDITLLRPARATQLAEDAAAGAAEPLEDAAVRSGEEPPEVIGRLRGIDLDEALPEPKAQAVRGALR